MSRLEVNNQIVNTMVSQLGGNRFFAMTGSKPLYKNCNCDNPLITLQLRRNLSKSNYLTITYIAGADLYKMEFIRLTKTSRDIVKEFTDVYCDQLQELFTQVTGLYTRL